MKLKKKKQKKKKKKKKKKQTKKKNTKKLRSFKSSEHINEKGDGPYRGFDYYSLVNDPLDLTTWSQRE